MECIHRIHEVRRHHSTIISLLAVRIASHWQWATGHGPRGAESLSLSLSLRSICRAVDIAPSVMVQLFFRAALTIRTYRSAFSYPADQMMLMVRRSSDWAMVALVAVNLEGRRGVWRHHGYTFALELVL